MCNDIYYGKISLWKFDADWTIHEDYKIFTPIPCQKKKVEMDNTLVSTRCYLTHWGRVTHICVSKLTIIVSDNGLSPDRSQAIIWTNAGILLIGPLGTNFSEILNRNSNIFIQENAFENVVCETAAILSWPQCVNSSILKFQSRTQFIDLSTMHHGTANRTAFIPLNLLQCYFITDLVFHKAFIIVCFPMPHKCVSNRLL